MFLQVALCVSPSLVTRSPDDKLAYTIPFYLREKKLLIPKTLYIELAFNPLPPLIPRFFFFSSFFNVAPLPLPDRFLIRDINLYFGMFKDLNFEIKRKKHLENVVQKGDLLCIGILYR